jgi:putative ABC transport system permease protein
MGAVATKTRADLRRRRLQAFALASVLFLATGAATLALNILVASHEPFERAFAAANGAHLAIAYDPSVTDTQLAATAEAGGVTATTGPYPITQGGFGYPMGGSIGGLALAGRPAPDTSVDTVSIVAGRWWSDPGEIVLDQDTAWMFDRGIGESIDVYQAPAGADGTMPDGDIRPVPAAGEPSLDDEPKLVLSLTVVGIARSVSTPDIAAWLSPVDLIVIAGDRSPAREMLYRVEPAATAADLTAATARITAGLDPGVIVNRVSYLDTRASVNDTADLYVPVLLAFALFALLAAMFSIANVISGIVLSTYRDIGVMKAVGFTPGQVSTMLLVQILGPAIVGTVLGVAVGAIASQPTVSRTTESFGLPGSPTFSPLALFLVPAAAILLAALAAIGPAFHAGRLSAVGAITRGTMPSIRGAAARMRGLGFRLPASLPVRLGLMAGIAHPVRAAMTLGALIVGVAAVTFAIGTNLSLVRIVGQLDRAEAAPVRAELAAGTSTQSPDEITELIAELAETAHVVAIGQDDVSVPILGSVPFVGYDGDASWTGYTVIAGRWLDGPGEAVAPTSVFRQAGLEVGDTVEVRGEGRTLSLTLVGEIFDTADHESDNDLVLRGAFEDLARLVPAAALSSWEMQPIEGTSAEMYRATVTDATGQGLPVYSVDDASSDEEFLLFLSVVTFLGVVLVAISLGGVFNTVLLETRQRWHELAVLKAVGLTPNQVLGMVLASVLVIGLIAGLVGVPLGLVMERAVIGYMGETAANLFVPDVSYDVFMPLAYLGLVLTGVAIAVAGAVLPARRAATIRVAPVLQAE